MGLRQRPGMSGKRMFAANAAGGCSASPGRMVVFGIAANTFSIAETCCPPAHLAGTLCRAAALMGRSRFYVAAVPPIRSARNATTAGWSNAAAAMGSSLVASAIQRVLGKRKYRVVKNHRSPNQDAEAGAEQMPIASTLWQEQLPFEKLFSTESAKKNFLTSQPPIKRSSSILDPRHACDLALIRTNILMPQPSAEIQTSQKN